MSFVSNYDLYTEDVSSLGVDNKTGSDMDAGTNKNATSNNLSLPVVMTTMLLGVSLLVILSRTTNLTSSSSSSSSLSSWSKRLSNLVGHTTNTTTNDGTSLTLKERLKKQGLNTMLLFVLLGNICNGIFLSFAWYIFCLQTKESPFYPGQWKPFLAAYTGIMAADTTLKPIRLAIAIGLSSYTDRSMVYMEDKIQSRKLAVAGAFLIVCLLTFGIMFGGVAIASSMSGVPIFVGSSSQKA